MSVIAAVELHDLVATRVAARETHGAHQRLGTRRNQSYLFEAGHSRDHRFGEQDLTRRRRAEGRSLTRRLAKGVHDVGVRVAEE